MTFQERDNKANELRKLEAELAALGVAAKEGVEAAGKVKSLEKENKSLADENKVLTENYNSERVGEKKTVVITDSFVCYICVKNMVKSWNSKYGVLQVLYFHFVWVYCRHIEAFSSFLLFI